MPEKISNYVVTLSVESIERVSKWLEKGGGEKKRKKKNEEYQYDV